MSRERPGKKARRVAGLVSERRAGTASVPHRQRPQLPIIRLLLPLAPLPIHHFAGFPGYPLAHLVDD